LHPLDGEGQLGHDVVDECDGGLLVAARVGANTRSRVQSSMAVNVADLAGQVQDHACQSDRPIWAPQGSHPSTSLIGEITVWQAANGINPQDLRPTGGTQLETLPALWKERLDRDIARATYPPADARADERQAAHTPHLDAGMTTASANTKNRNDARGGPRLADSTPTRRIAALGP
jgi:hypothetical protein